MLRRVDHADWLLTKSERANPSTRIDDQHEGDRAWSTGNLVRPLIHGATYFPALHEAIEATRAGDLVLFTDWQGDADERLTGEPGSEVVEVLASADERGVDVRGLVWRSHLDATGFFAGENRHLGEQLQSRGAGPSWTCGCARAARTTRSSSWSGTATTRRETWPSSEAWTSLTTAVTTRTTGETRNRSH